MSGFYRRSREDRCGTIKPRQLYLNRDPTMTRNTAVSATGARIATSVAIGLAATFLFACADDSTPTTPALAPSAASASRLPVTIKGRIVFNSDRDRTPGTGYDIYSMMPDGSNVTRLTASFDNEMPALSPDGKRIAFMSNRDNGAYDIYVMNSDGTGVKRLAPSTAWNYKPTWSADGSKIVFTSTRDAADPNDRGTGASWEVYTVTSDGLTLTRVTNNSVGEFDPQLSPDGTRIVFASDRDHDSFWIRDLYVMNVDGTNVHRLTSQTGQLENPSFDPTGARIVYDIQSAGGVGGIFVLNGHATTQLRVNSGSTEFAPAWSPDGKQIAFTHHVSGGDGNILKMDADGSNVKYLTRSQGNSLRPDWGR
jgi:TolB protein